MSKLKDRKIIGIAFTTIMLALSMFYFVGCGGKDGDRSDRYRYNDRYDSYGGRNGGYSDRECRREYPDDQRAINLCIDDARRYDGGGYGNGTELSYQECDQVIRSVNQYSSCDPIGIQNLQDCEYYYQLCIRDYSGGI